MVASLLSLRPEIHERILVLAGALESTGVVNQRCRLELALVCKSWWHIIRPLLFKNITIYVFGDQSTGVTSHEKKFSLDVIEVMLRQNPVIGSYVNSIKVCFKFTIPDGRQRHIQNLKVAMTKLFLVLSLIAEPRLKRSKDLLFAPRQDLLTINMAKYKIDHFQNYACVDLITSGWKPQSVNAPVSLMISDDFISARVLHPDSLLAIVKSFLNLRDLNIDLSTTLSRNELGSVLYPSILHFFLHLPRTIKKLFVLLDDRYRPDRWRIDSIIERNFDKLISYQDPAKTQPYEAHVKFGGRGDRLGRILCDVSTNLESFTYVGFITPELFGMRAVTTSASTNLDMDDGHDYDNDCLAHVYQPIEPSKSWPFLKDLRICFSSFDSFGDELTPRKLYRGFRWNNRSQSNMKELDMAYSHALTGMPVIDEFVIKSGKFKKKKIKAAMQKKN
ncbi:hypothetical protein V1514DRAFT_85091 [Lipomyces japonicus]|uniref:uncharacterized protein n=1 Tax=Lipomyces japonicus TaxID=56871 RepID=UPI0034D01250